MFSLIIFNYFSNIHNYRLTEHLWSHHFPFLFITSKSFNTHCAPTNVYVGPLSKVCMTGLKYLKRSDKNDSYPDLRTWPFSTSYLIVNRFRLPLLTILLDAALMADGEFTKRSGWGWLSDTLDSTRNTKTQNKNLHLAFQAICGQKYQCIRDYKIIPRDWVDHIYVQKGDALQLWQHTDLTLVQFNLKTMDIYLSSWYLNNTSRDKTNKSKSDQMTCLQFYLDYKTWAVKCSPVY